MYYVKSLHKSVDVFLHGQINVLWNVCEVIYGLLEGIDGFSFNRSDVKVSNKDEEGLVEAIRSNGQVGQVFNKEDVKEDKVLNGLKQAFIFRIEVYDDGHLYQANDVHENHIFNKSCIIVRGNVEQKRIV